MVHLSRALADWHIPELPDELGGADRRRLDPRSVKALIRQRLSGDVEDRSQIQIAISGWLYELVRRNFKRGRAFELDEVLSTRRADCLGYARLFSVLGPAFGLVLGVVEVLIDNAGRYVPHHVNILNLADGTPRFIDAWYGSVNINHRRIGALVNGKPRDIDIKELSGVSGLQGLPQTCVEAIALYIKGNRCLERNELDKAIKYYSAAVELYPNNSRAYYNQAIAREAKGDVVGAGLDYARALKDESSLIRVLATTHELEEMIRLDEEGISEREQNMYLWYKGYKTGAPAGYEEIGHRYGMSPENVKKVITGVESICTG